MEMEMENSLISLHDFPLASITIAMLSSVKSDTTAFASPFSSRFRKISQASCFSCSNSTSRKMLASMRYITIPFCPYPARFMLQLHRALFDVLQHAPDSFYRVRYTLFVSHFPYLLHFVLARPLGKSPFRCPAYRAFAVAERFHGSFPEHLFGFVRNFYLHFAHKYLFPY